MTATTSLLSVLGTDVQVGRDLGQEEIPITRDLVQWYTEATESEHPWYMGSSPFGGPIAPAMLLHSPQSRVLRDWFLPNMYGNLHAKMAWELYRPVPVGSSVTRRGTVLERYLKRDREFVVGEAQLFDEQGRLCARSQHTQSFLADPSVTGIVVARGREKQAGRAFVSSELEGDVLRTLAGARQVVTAERCNRFSSGRANYHNDVAEAEKLGFKEVVVQGTFSICFLSDMLTEAYGEGWFLGGRLKLNLVNVLWAGEAVQARGVVRARSREGSLWREHLDVWTEKDDGTRTIAGTASAVTLPG
jgi:acyl dehydratase